MNLECWESPLLKFNSVKMEGTSDLISVLPSVDRTRYEYIDRADSFTCGCINCYTHRKEVGHVQSNQLIPRARDYFWLWLGLHHGDGRLRRRWSSSRCIGRC